jgi:hypothetical protein
MEVCHHCGASVSRAFARVFGTNDDEVYACPSCSTYADIIDEGLAATPRASGE